MPSVSFSSLRLIELLRTAVLDETESDGIVCHNVLSVSAMLSMFANVPSFINVLSSSNDLMSRAELSLMIDCSCEVIELVG